MSERLESTFSSMKKYRDASDIIYIILKYLASETGTRTDILYEARMSYTQLTGYMKLLLEKNLIVLSNDKKSHGTRYTDSYSVTQKGLHVIDAMEKLRDLMK